MLKRVLTFWAGFALLGVMSAVAQVPLEGAIAKIGDDKLGEAEQELQGYIAQNPKNLDEVYYWIGRINYLREDYEKARQSFQAGLGARSKSPLNQAGMALLNIREGKAAEAKAMVESAREINKGKNADVEYACAEAYLQGAPSEINAAKVILYDMRTKDPGDPRPYIYLGEYYKKVGVPELALEDLKKAIDKQPKYVPAYVAVAELKYQEGKETQSVEAFNEAFNYATKAIELKPEFAPAYRIRGELYLLTKKYDAATADLKKYVSLTGNDVQARIRYASFLFLAEKYQESLDEMSKVQQETGTVTNLMRRLRGMSLAKLGRYTDAKASFDEYFSLVKEEYYIFDDYATYADILREGGNFDEADKYYAKAVTMKPDRAIGTYEKLADLYFNRGKEGEDQFKKLDTQRRALMKEAQAAAEQNTAFAAAGNTEEANKQYDIYEAKLKQAAELEKQAAQVRDAYVATYAAEARYRTHLLDAAKDANEVKNTHYYKLGVAQYKGKLYQGAEASFNGCLEIQKEFATPYLFLFNIADLREREDTTRQDWYSKAVAERVLSVWGEKPAAELDKSTRSVVLTALGVMAFYNFDPEAKGAVQNCAAAQPWVDKIKAIDPNFATVKPLEEYCTANGGR
ncbi:MAG: tetratricopeptide repeat protein [Bacteroidia bacterium]|nr:tetratricopeptide repeat protein [Bacteroidia bacterium]